MPIIQQVILQLRGSMREYKPFTIKKLTYSEILRTASDLDGVLDGDLLIQEKV
jgi:hypothetical protein